MSEAETVRGDQVGAPMTAQTPDAGRDALVEFRRGLMCLRLEVDGSIVDDLSRLAEAALAEARKDGAVELVPLDQLSRGD